MLLGRLPTDLDLLVRLYVRASQCVQGPGVKVQDLVSGLTIIQKDNDAIKR